MSREQFGSDNWRTGEALLGLGLCLAASGQRAQVEPVLHQAYEVVAHAKRAHHTASPA